MRSRLSISLTFLIAFAVLGGCSRVQVSQDYDPLAAVTPHRTWQWETSTQPPTGDVRVDNPLLDKRIRRAIETHLAGRSIRQSDRQPDLMLAYHLSIQSKLQSYSTSPSLGIGYYNYPWYGGYETETHISQYDECQLTIDIRSGDADTLLWRGTGVYRYRTHKTPDAAAADMQATVDRILTQFPPAES